MPVIGRRKGSYAQRLGRVVDSLPFETQQAMLQGLRRYDRIITGAYSDREGGVCPMLAAHRSGGRTDFRSFARAWDRFTGAKRRPRPVTGRELRTLTAQLHASVWKEEQRQLVARAARERAERITEQRQRRTAPVRYVKTPIKPSRVRSWLGPFRRWDRYRNTIARVSRELDRSGALDPHVHDTDGSPRRESECV